VNFCHVLHVPALRNNLLSPFLLAKQNGYTATINVPTFNFLLGDKVVLTATVNSQNIGYLNGHSVVYPHLTNYATANVSSTCPLDLVLWHRRLGHIDYQTIKTMHRKKLVKGMTIAVSSKPDPI
ncbi:hypothetical protein BT96DRAFT_764343, partial [Gymnopus androsaceus JB14]